jgi:hypothetical protein
VSGFVDTFVDRQQLIPNPFVQNDQFISNMSKVMLSKPYDSNSQTVSECFTAVKERADLPLEHFKCQWVTFCKGQKGILKPPAVDT